MGRLVLLICILNPREARDQGRMKPFARGQVDLRELEQIYCIPELSIHPLLVRDTWSPICNIYFLHYLSTLRTVTSTTPSEQTHSQ